MGQFGIGQSVTRIEDLRLLTGSGKYTDDMQLENETHAFVLRSPHAHAEIRGMNIEAAKAAPGVLLVLTGDDVKADDLGPMPCMFPVTNLDGSARGETYRPLLAQGKVRHVGEPVAFIVAETLEQAHDAAELIEVDYKVLPATTHTYRSAQDGAVQIHDGIANNVCFDWGKGQQEET
jgi:carbon-monoxide dehydrogenase large subunit